MDYISFLLYFSLLSDNTQAINLAYCVWNRESSKENQAKPDITLSIFCKTGAWIWNVAYAKKEDHTYFRITLHCLVSFFTYQVAVSSE